LLSLLLRSGRRLALGAALRNSNLHAARGSLVLRMYCHAARNNPERHDGSNSDHMQFHPADPSTRRQAWAGMVSSSRTQFRPPAFAT
jgi:hypothetical protein